MNKIENLMWKAKVGFHRKKAFFKVLNGDGKGANEEYGKVLNMLEAYKAFYLDGSVERNEAVKKMKSEVDEELSKE